MTKILKAQKYMYENITGEDYKNKHLIQLLEILGQYPIPKCKKRKEMTFPTPDEIKLDMNQLIIKPLNRPFIPVELKQQILSEHEIVERLKEKLKKLYTKDFIVISGDLEQDDTIKRFVEAILKSILENKK